MRRIGLLSLALLITVALGACRSSTAEIDPETGALVASSHGKRVAKNLSSNLTYFEDISTGLCYGYLENNSGDFMALTQVTCENVRGKTLKFESHFQARTAEALE